MASTQELIETAVHRFQAEVPALAKLKLTFELELRGRGDVQMYRVELPGPKVSKGVAEDARATVEIQRADFNQLATEGTTKSYRQAFEQGHIKASGDPNVLKLIAQVVERHDQRARLRKVH
jgi:alkyl sulfatase BDS1-like metallo-beta-lactamase superfamily hydrolase